MARIRSIHPGLYTDEAFVSCTLPARLLVIGLWTEADDQGVFEWKPIVIRMRLFPADSFDVAALLAELVEFNFVKRFSANGRDYGAIRNFRRFQRPKKPNSTHPLPDEFRTYVALDSVSSEPDDDDTTLSSEPTKHTPATVPNLFPTGGEKSPQMEDVGSKKRSLSETTDDPGPKTRKRNLYPEDFEAFWQAYPVDKLMSKAEAGKAWAKLAPEDRANAATSVPAFRSYCQKNPTYHPVHAVRYLTQRRFDGFAAAQPPAGTPAGSNGAAAGWSIETLRKIALGYLIGRDWPQTSMPEPGTEGSPVTKAILDEMRPEAQEKRRRMMELDRNEDMRQ